MHKKAQSISINTIIIAAIALAVLVVLFVVFTGRFKLFSEGVKESGLTCDKACKSTGYASGIKAGGCAGTVELSGKFEDMSERQVCCCVSK